MAKTGGHAPRYLRDAFHRAVDAFENWEDGSRKPVVELRAGVVPISAVFDLLCNCSDLLPDVTWQQLIDLGAESTMEGGSYGDAARWLKLATMRRETP
jgi:hypothetical protein